MESEISKSLTAFYAFIFFWIMRRKGKKRKIGKKVKKIERCGNVTAILTLVFYEHKSHKYHT